MNVGDETTIAGMKAVVVRVEGSKTVFHLGTEKVEVTIDGSMKPTVTSPSRAAPGTNVDVRDA